MHVSQMFTVSDQCEISDRWQLLKSAKNAGLSSHPSEPEFTEVDFGLLMCLELMQNYKCLCV